MLYNVQLFKDFFGHESSTVTDIKLKTNKVFRNRLFERLLLKAV